MQNYTVLTVYISLGELGGDRPYPIQSICETARKNAQPYCTEKVASFNPRITTQELFSNPKIIYYLIIY